MRLSQLLCGTTLLASAVVLSCPEGAQALSFRAVFPEPLGMSRVVRQHLVSVLSVELARFNTLIVAGQQTALGGQGVNSRFTFDARDPLAKEASQATVANQDAISGHTASNFSSGSSPSNGQLTHELSDRSRISNGSTIGGIYVPDVAPNGADDNWIADPESRFW